jgi:hypothetical protein
MITLFSCGGEAPKKDTPPPAKPRHIKTIDFIAGSFIKLCFQLARHDPSYVDAYFGPEELKNAAEADEKTLAQIRKSLFILLEELGKVTVPGSDRDSGARRKYLLRMLQAMESRLHFLEGAEITFDQESKGIYDAVSPSFPPEHYEAILTQLDALLPGDAPLPERVNDFKNQFVIPKDKVDAVFKAAIAEGRKRTKVHIQLPENEDFQLEYVSGKSWGAYNWFKGGAVSLIQVNTDLPITIDRAVDLACHEGYPGHHVYYTLIEQVLYKKNGWLEFSIYPLFSPLSLIAEGTANFGIQVAFPGDQRMIFEKEVLFPLAGLDPANADRYYKMLELTGRLSFAGNEAARGFIDGKLTEEQTVDLLMKFRLMSKERAEKYLSFIKTYRAYVINYNLGLQMVKAYIEKKGGSDEQPGKRWQEFKKLMSSPLLPGDLE